MAFLRTQRLNLPPDAPVSEWSRRFYDGTFRWDAEGFENECGGMYPARLQA